MTSLLGELAELHGIQLVGAYLQAVTVAFHSVQAPGRGEQPAYRPDLGPQRARADRRAVFLPQRLRQPADGHLLVGVQQQHRQQGPLPRLRDLQTGAVITDHLKPTQNTEPHQPPQPTRRLINPPADNLSESLCRDQVPRLPQ